MSYCLLRIFDINMPLLYGEGKKAFLRLQQEIMARSEDYSFLLWTAPATNHCNPAYGNPEAPESFSVLVPESSYFDVAGMVTSDFGRCQYERIEPHKRFSPLFESQDIVQAWTARLPSQLTSRGLRVNMALGPKFAGFDDGPRDFVKGFLLWTGHTYNDGYMCIRVRPILTLDGTIVYQQSYVNMVFLICPQS